MGCVTRWPHGVKIDRAAQQKAWRAAGVHGSGMKQQRVSQDDVTRCADVLDDLQLDAVVLLGARHEARNAFIGACLLVQIADVRVAHERFAMIAAARAGCGGWCSNQRCSSLCEPARKKVAPLLGSTSPISACSLTPSGGASALV